MLNKIKDLEINGINIVNLIHCEYTYSFYVNKRKLLYLLKLRRKIKKIINKIC